MAEAATTGQGTDESVVVRWYTRARKFPQLIGKTPDGKQIWGGPYTVTQVCGAFGVLLLGYWTMSLWGRFGLFLNALILAAAFAGTVVMLGRIPVGSRNPLAIVSGACRAVAAPATGRLGGRPVRVRRPHSVCHRVLIALDDLPDVTSTAVPTVDLVETAASGTSPAPAPQAAPAVAPPALTGVQALLASRGLTTTHDQETH